MRYVVVSIVVLTFVALVTRPWRPDFPRKSALITFAILALLTLIFDNMLVGLNIVAYKESAISGVRLGTAPIEDFAYTVAVCLIIPRFWQRWHKS